MQADPQHRTEYTTTGASVIIVAFPPSPYLSGDASKKESRLSQEHISWGKPKTENSSRKVAEESLMLRIPKSFNFNFILRSSPGTNESCSMYVSKSQSRVFPSALIRFFAGPV